MEGIVKISRITAEAVATLSRDEFIFSERLADEGGEPAAIKKLDKLLKENVLWTPTWVYVYIADQRGGIFMGARPSPKPTLTDNYTA